jgi:F0F1-type ATP synthase delta subunit
MKSTPARYAQIYLTAASKLPSAKRGEVARTFWQMVWRQGKFKWSRQILAALQQLLRKQKGVVLAHILTPQPLNDSQKHALISQLSQAINKPVELDCQVKPHLLAGMVVTVDDKRYDASLKGRLDSLYTALAGDNQ